MLEQKLSEEDRRERLLQQWKADIIQDPHSRRTIDEIYKSRVTEYNLHAKESKNRIVYQDAREVVVNSILQDARRIELAREQARKKDRGLDIGM